VLEAKHTEYVSTQNPATPTIINVKSSNPSVATATVYRVSQVQIVAVAPGRTDVEFFDTTQGVLYRVSVWVEKPNPTGVGGAGYDPGKTQLPQVVMLVKHTHNVTVPGGGNHQLSSVVSSNPSVATARTNTKDTIQIYSVALGDTFINFTDNATGTTYQVHVWVVKNLSDPVGGGGGGDTTKPGPKVGPSPKPDSKPIAGGRAGKVPIDRCLVGTWRSESVRLDPVPEAKGGADIILTIKGDGTESLDYNQMKPLRAPGPVGETINTWAGTATGRITATNGTAKVDRVDESNLSHKLIDPNGKTTTNSMGQTLGPGAVGADPRGGYACDETTLTFKTTVHTLKFKREKKGP
jgi:hypothetical protein